MRFWPVQGKWTRVRREQPFVRGGSARLCLCLGNTPLWFLFDCCRQQADAISHTHWKGWRKGQGGGWGRETALAFKWKIEFITWTCQTNAKSPFGFCFFFIFIPFANSMEIFCWQISFETHVINLFVQHFATLKQLPQHTCPNPRVQLATCHLFCNIFHS